VRTTLATDWDWTYGTPTTVTMQVLADGTVSLTAGTINLSVNDTTYTSFFAHKVISSSATVPQIDYLKWALVE
jgi:hypothetical protein